MADGDKEFKIHIATTADTGAINQTKDALGSVTDATKGLGDAEDKTASSARHSFEEHHALHEALRGLNVLVPGLGDALFILASGYRGAAEAADAATAANDTMMASMEEMAVVLLTIQAAIQYWDAYKDHVKEAQEETSRRTKQIVEDTQSALKAFQDFQNALNGGDESASKKYSDDLQQRRTILEAKQRQEQEELKVSEAAKLEQATSPEQKAAITKWWDAAAERLKEAQAQEQQGLVTDVLRNVQSDIDTRTRQVQEDNAGMHDAYQTMIRSGDRTGFVQRTNDVKENTTAVKQLTDLLTGLQSEAGAKGAVAGIDAQTYAAVQGIQNRGDFQTGVKAMMGDFGPKLTGQQQAAEQAVAQIFQDHSGRLDVWLNHLREFRQNYQQRNTDIDREFERLSHQMRNVSINATQ